MEFGLLKFYLAIMVKVIFRDHSRSISHRLGEAVCGLRWRYCIPPTISGGDVYNMVDIAEPPFMPLCKAGSLVLIL